MSKVPQGFSYGVTGIILSIRDWFSNTAKSNRAGASSPTSSGFFPDIFSDGLPGAPELPALPALPPLPRGPV